MSIEGNFPKMDRREFLKRTAFAISNLNEHKQESREDIPNEAGILDAFDKLRGKETPTERRYAKDEHGVYLWEVEFQIEGGSVEFGYMRKGKHAVGGSASATKIYLTYFDSDGMPEGGHDVAVYTDGKWAITGAAHV
jgi:hypothetical protein